MNPLRLVLRLVAVAGLGVDAYEHAHLASSYRGLGGHLSQADLFVAEAVVAGIVAVALLVTDATLAWIAALVVAASALGAVLLYRYVDVGPLGPLPNMYEPVWYADKVIAAAAEAAALLAALLGLATARSPGREWTRTPPTGDTTTPGFRLRH
jgi:hypothetical protein